MPWWAWIAAFGVILGAGGWWLWVQARAAWASATRLGQQLAQTSDQLTHLEPGASRLLDEEPQLAVFTSPYQAHKERTEIRETLQSQRRARREATLPPWLRR